MYRSDIPMADMLSPGFFATINRSLMVGDSIRIQQTEGIKDDERLIAQADVIVTFVKGRHVETQMDGEVIEFKEPEYKEKTDPAEPVEKYVEGTGTVKWNLGLQKHEVLVDGKVVASAAKKAVALAIANGDKPYLVAA